MNIKKDNSSVAKCSDVIRDVIIHLENDEPDFFPFKLSELYKKIPYFVWSNYELFKKVFKKIKSDLGLKWDSDKRGYIMTKTILDVLEDDDECIDDSNMMLVSINSSAESPLISALRKEITNSLDNIVSALSDETIVNLLSDKVRMCVKEEFDKKISPAITVNIERAVESRITELEHDLTQKVKDSIISLISTKG